MKQNEAKETMRETRLYTKEPWLREQYWGKKLSAGKIATMCCVKANTIRKHMNRLGISARSYSEARLINYPVSPYRNKKWLEKAYWKEGNSLPDLSILCGKDRTTIRAWFEGFGIPRRGIAEAGRLMRKKRCRSKFGQPTAWLWNIAKKFNIYMREQNRQIS